MRRALERGACGEERREGKERRLSIQGKRVRFLILKIEGHRQLGFLTMGGEKTEVVDWVVKMSEGNRRTPKEREWNLEGKPLSLEPIRSIVSATPGRA